MIFYKHYIGDFQRDTGHLSLTQRGAYLALIHHYYATEKPLPNDVQALCRIAGATTSAERTAVKSVMCFFESVESGLMHSRIEAEIQKSGDISNTNRVIALAREAKRRAEKDARNEHEHSTNRAKSVSRNEHEHSTNQTPDTRHQTKTTEVNTHRDNSQDSSAGVSSDHPALIQAASFAGECCRAMIGEGISGCNPSHPTLIALIDAGADPQEFVNASRSSITKGKTSFAYVLGTVKKQREDAAKMILHRGSMPTLGRQNSVQDARLDIARQIFGDQHGKNRPPIDVTPHGSDPRDPQGVREDGAFVRQPAICQMAGDEHG